MCVTLGLFWPSESREQVQIFSMNLLVLIGAKGPEPSREKPGVGEGSTPDPPESLTFPASPSSILQASLDQAAALVAVGLATSFPNLFSPKLR